jgi:iron-regulated transporter 1
MDEREPLVSQSTKEGSSDSSKSESIDDDGVVLAEEKLDNARWLLYISHMFNQFSEQAWQFCVALFLAAFTNNQSLILVTSYGLVTYSTVCFFGSSIGRYIDKSNRLAVARLFIGLENLAVLTATVMCYILLSRDKDTTMISGPLYDTKSVLLLVSIHLLGAVAMILDSGFLVAVERDWIVVMSVVASNIHKSKDSSTKEEEEDNTQKEWLSDTNVKMRQIDLSCKILAPAISGILLASLDDGTSENHGYNLRGATLMIGGVNATALIVEYICTAKIYHEIPELAMKSFGEIAEDKKKSEIKLDNNGREHKNGHTESTSKPKILVDLEVYFSQSICWAGFSLSLLYLNVALSFGNIMTVYLVWRGIGLEAIGLWRGVSSAMGLAGTFVYHILAQKLGLVDVGMISVTFEFLCLAICFGSLFVNDNDVFFIMLIAGVCFSRIGLWVFDISVTQLMQLHIPPPVRGLVGGVQSSMNAFFTVMIYVAGLFLSDPENFKIFASISFAGVTSAAIFYGIMVFARRRIFMPTKDDNNASSV